MDSVNDLIAGIVARLQGHGERISALERIEGGFVPTGARVYNSSNITIPANTPTDLTFDSERFDTASYHSTSSNTGRLTVPEDGIYLICADVRWETSSTGRRRVAIFMNGDTNLARVWDETNTIASDEMEQSLTTIYQMSTGEYVEVRVLQNSGGNLDVEAAANHSPEFSIWRIG